MLRATLLPSTTRDTTTTTSTSTSPTSLFTRLAPTLTKTPAPTAPTTTPIAPVPATPAAPPYTCVSDVCTGTTPAADFLFKTLQTLINMGSQKLVSLGKAAAAPLAINGKLDQRTLAAYLPIARTVGGPLAIFDFTPAPPFLAKNAPAFALEILKWLGMTWVSATATAPGHWERLRAGQLPMLPPAPTPALCPPGSVTTSQGCLWPPGTIAAFNRGRGKWRIAVPAGTPGAGRGSQPLPLPLPQSQLQPQPQPQPSSGRAPTLALGWEGLGAASHVIVAELDTLPSGVTAVSEQTLVAASSEAPTPTPAPAPSTVVPFTPTTAPTPAPTTAPAPTPAPAPTAEPAVAPSTEAVSTEETVPTAAPGRYSGCIARFNRTRKVFAIYCPVGTLVASSPSGFGVEYFRCLTGDCGAGLGGDNDVTPPVPEGLTKVAETATLPNEGETPAGEEKDKFFRLNNPLMWAAFAGAAIVLGGGGYMLYRRRGNAPSGLGTSCPKGQLWLESREICVDANEYWNEPEKLYRRLGPRRSRK